MDVQDTQVVKEMLIEKFIGNHEDTEELVDLLSIDIHVLVVEEAERRLAAMPCQSNIF